MLGKTKAMPNDRAAEREQLQPQPVAVADGDSMFEQELQDAQNEIKVSFNRNLEGAFIRSSVDGGAFIARVGAICLGLNSSTSDRAEKLSSNPLHVSNILDTIKGKYA
ncbi:hypothetical protein P5673_027020 [Acropora cervicornis]|uniref:Uncharacterized protein n=1 Tax=Acropora cervicornis TaxID=6130 RepID=A0AAD9Q040_ACRCE|nr:hypothetical protein P5673_027020 [Acropora cervicornis]